MTRPRGRPPGNRSRRGVVGNDAASSPYLFGTRDGGRSWTQASLALPPTLQRLSQAGNLYFLTRQFSSAAAGVVPVCTGDGTGHGIWLDFYTTAAAGARWRGSGPPHLLRHRTCFGVFWGFFDQAHGWLAAGEHLRGHPMRVWRGAARTLSRPVSARSAC